MYVFAIKTNFKNKTHQMMIKSMNRNYSILILYVLSKVPKITRSVSGRILSKNMYRKFETPRA